MNIYKLKYYLSSLILFVAFNLYSQTGDPYSTYTINSAADRNDLVTDLYFIDYNTGYVTAVYGYPEGSNTQTYCKLYKTTNGGINWVKQWEFVFTDDNHSIQKLALSFSNVNTGYFIKQSAKDFSLKRLMEEVIITPSSYNQIFLIILMNP